MTTFQRRPFGLSASSVLIFAAFCFTGALPAVAETGPQKTNAAAAAPASTAANAPSAGAIAGGRATPSLSVQGFRSAKFGMTEAEVRASIAKDFSVPATAVRAESNSAERTQSLTVKVPDLLPDSGAADVSYVFGYHSKKLIHVGVLWSKTVDETMTPERLLANAEALRGYFLTDGFVPKSIVTNAAIGEGVMFFRGEDVNGHSTVLILKGTMGPEGQKPRAFTPTATVLYYMADAEHPDVYKVPAGKF
jgi:hypothetical protein